ncbi:MAG: hypothetical protein R2819_08370 [Allomuricauda sp.]
MAYHLLLILLLRTALTGNAVLRLDTWLIGLTYVPWRGIAFVPEGLLSTLPAIVNVVAGVSHRNVHPKNGQNYETIAKLMMIRYCISSFCQLSVDLLLPIKQKVMDSSFAACSGIDMCLIAVWFMCWI